MKTYTLHRINLLSLFKFGFVTGLIAAFLPIGLGMIVSWTVATAVSNWLNGLAYVIPLPIPGVSDISIRGVDLLQAGGFLDLLEIATAMGWLQVFLWIFVLTITAGLWTGLIAVLSGAAFNLLARLSGGLQMSLSEDGVQARQPPQPAINAGTPGQRPQVTGPRLEITAPIQRVVPITSQTTLIGSSPECTLQLDGLQPRHAQLSYENGMYILRDLGQGNIKVQSRVIDGMNMVRDGFLIQIGQYHLTFRH